MSEGKRKRNYFNTQQKKKQHVRTALEAGMTGFLCTCNFCEKDCVRDAYRILNEYLEKEQTNQDKEDSNSEIKESANNDKTEESETNKQNAEDEEEDISASLEKEIKSLKSESGRIFQACDTGVKNMVFIQSKNPNPLNLALSIMKDAYETKKRKTRFIMRLLPIEVVCKAYTEVIKSKADPIFDQYFVKEPKSFAIVFNRHSNNSVQRNEVIQELAELISKKNSQNKVDLKSPDLTVVIEIIRSFCLLSVVPEYSLYKKYNLTELFNTDSKIEKQTPSKDINEEKTEENDSVKMLDSTVDEEKND